MEKSVQNSKQQQPDLGTPPSASDGKPFVSTGQKVHKWSTYLGVDWILNAIAGVGFSYWGNHTKTGQKLWGRPVKAMFTKALGGFEYFKKNPKVLESSVSNGGVFMSVIAGGMFTIPPLLALENKENRIGITRWWDKLIYGKDRVERDPKFEQSYRDIREEPEKDFTTGMTSRFAALAPLLALVITPKVKDVSASLYFDHVSSASEKSFNALGFSKEKMFEGVSKREPETGNMEERWKNIHDSMATDFGLGIPYAILHSFFYDMFSGQADKREEQQTEHIVKNINKHSSPHIQMPVSKPQKELIEASPKLAPHQMPIESEAVMSKASTEHSLTN